jgi:hypothetical protein
MPRPVSKKELLELSESNLAKLYGLINELPDEFKNKTFTKDELNDRDKTVSDVLCHLHEWHVMMASWYKVGMAGKKPEIPGKGYTWQTLPGLNHEIYEKYKGTELKKALSLLKKSHKDIMALVESHNDEELFTKKKYAWTGTTSLGAYFISATSSHYDWAFKTIKPLKKLIEK